MNIDKKIQDFYYDNGLDRLAKQNSIFSMFKDKGGHPVKYNESFIYKVLLYREDNSFRKTAKHFGISQSTLHKFIKSYDIREV